MKKLSLCAVGFLALSCGQEDVPNLSSSIKKLAPANRTAAKWPFQSRSPWNVPLATSAQYGSGSNSCTRDLRDGSIDIGVNSKDWSHPIFIAKNSDPSKDVYLDPRGKQGNGYLTTIKFPSNAKAALPAFDGDGDSDAHLHIIDPSGHYVHEMWKAWKQSNGWHTYGFSEVNLYGSGIDTGERCYGGSAIGGLIRKEELGSDAFIPHAIAVALPAKKLKCCDPVWPASAVDGGADKKYKGNVPIGQLFAILADADLDSLGLSPVGYAIATALQNYGGYVVDSSGTVSIYAETAAADRIPDDISSDLKKLRPYFSCIRNNRQNNVGGGDWDADRRADFAPDL